MVCGEREMAISEERNLVARDLHDSIAQGLTFLNIQVQMLDDSLRSGDVEEASGIVPALRAGVKESYEDVRELLLNYRSKLAEDDLAGALRTTVEKFRRQTGLQIELAQLPGCLDIGRQAGDLVALVAAQVAFHAQGGANEVLVALAIIARIVVIQPCRNRQQAAAQIERLNPAVADAVELTLEVDHTTRV